LAEHQAQHRPGGKRESGHCQRGARHPGQRSRIRGVATGATLCSAKIFFPSVPQFSHRETTEIEDFRGSIFQCCGRLVKPHGGGRRHFSADRSLYIAVNIAPQQLHGSKRADDVHLSLKTPGSQDLEIWASSVFWSVRKLSHLSHMVSRASTLPAARYCNFKPGQHESCARNSCADSALVC
jgi:hypothetical protein